MKLGALHVLRMGGIVIGTIVFILLFPPHMHTYKNMFDDVFSINVFAKLSAEPFVFSVCASYLLIIHNLLCVYILFRAGIV